MEPFLLGLSNVEGIEIVVVTSGNNKDTLYLNDGDVVYYILPGGSPVGRYNGYSRKNQKIWKDLLEKEKPDVIHIWGCESSMGIAVISACENKIPAVVYIQGLGEALDRYCEAGIDRKTQLRFSTFRDYIRRDTIWMQHKFFGRIAENEKWMLSHAHNAIVENKWCELHCNSIDPMVNIHYMPLSINRIFFEYKWGDDYKPHSIMCPLPYAPLKGLHILLKALGIVKRYYPDVKLSVPGNFRYGNSLEDKILMDGYTKYLRHIIKENHLEDSVEHLGILSPDEMVNRMCASNVFVMCSSIENHSSTLKEAMAVGVPCITSDVGGIAEYAKHEENALVYRFEEYELLAYNIMRCFESEELCKRLSENSRKLQRETSVEENTVMPIVDIYRKVIELKG